MRALTRLTTTTLPRATALRTLATRASTIDTLRSHRPASPQTDQSTSTPTTGTTSTPSSHPTVYGTNWTHWESSSHNPFLPDDRAARALYSTQIYHGQARRNLSHSARTHHPVIGSGPVTGAGTGVPISAQMFGSEVKGNPTESEADVAADRSDEDPLPPGLHHTIRMGAGEAAARPTESEEDVAADLGRWGEDPLGRGHVQGKKP